MTQRPLVMGIVNVTPDSFSDGGCCFDRDRAVAHGLRLAEEGADIIDVGGESTRPGSGGVDEEEERRRVVPVIEELARRVDAVISVDTVKSGVARAAVGAGARMVNDVSALRRDPEIASVAAAGGCDLVVMHSRGTPADMQTAELTAYGDVVREVVGELLDAVRLAEERGVPRSRIWIDPGIGFAKTAEQNIALLARLAEIAALGFPVLVGPSRKSFIGRLAGGEPGERLGGTAAAVAAAVLGGARAIRVHDVAIMRQAAIIAAAIAAAHPSGAGEDRGRHG